MAASVFILNCVIYAIPILLCNLCATLIHAYSIQVQCQKLALSRLHFTQQEDWYHPLWKILTISFYVFTTVLNSMCKNILASCHPQPATLRGWKWNKAICVKVDHPSVWFSNTGETILLSKYQHLCSCNKLLKSSYMYTG